MTQIQFLRMLGELGADEHGRRFMCPICGKEYDKVKTLHWHIKQQHMRARFKCMECGKEYMENYRLEEHIKTVHLGQEYQCPYEGCKRKYQAKKSLDNHIAIHKKEFLFQCEICDRGFRHKVQFEGHMNKHYGIKPYECATCGRCYTHGVDLTRHVKICGKGKTEKCTFCNKAFMYKKNVLQHIKKVHESTGARFLLMQHLRPGLRQQECSQWTFTNASFRCQKLNEIKKPKDIAIAVHSLERFRVCVVFLSEEYIEESYWSLMKISSLFNMKFAIESSSLNRINWHSEIRHCEYATSTQTYPTYRRYSCVCT